MEPDKATAWLIATRAAFLERLKSQPKPPEGVLAGPLEQQRVK